MLINKEQYDQCRWIIASCESKSQSHRGHEQYQFAHDTSVMNLHQRYVGQTLGLRAYNDPKILGWLETLDPKIFDISQTQSFFDTTSLPDIGIEWNEYRSEPMASTAHTVLEFMNRHHRRNTVYFKGDFWLFKNLIKNEIAHIDQIKKDSALVISFPFFEYFEKHQHMDEIMMQCEKLGVPVMLDLIWLPLLRDKPMLKHSDCVEVITHSFTKLIPLAGIKCGVAFWKAPVDADRITYPLGNRFGAWIVTEFLHKFGYNHALSYDNLQEKWCNALGLDKTNMVLSARIPENHFLIEHHLHRHRLDDALVPLFSLIGFYECDKHIENYLANI